jgi:dTDP-glucose 4,6-dehydratase
MENILVTGGAGFIGSNFIRHLLQHVARVQVVNFDSLTYAGNLENLVDVQNDSRYTFVRGDICDSGAAKSVLQAHRIDTIVHFAAESHVDRSILGAGAFMQTNVLGTHVLLEAARAAGVSRFLQVSTDEVYGSLGPQGRFAETTPLHPNSPYAASKASSDLLALSWHHTYGFPVIVTRCSNNYGPYQFPEKLIPLMICNALRDKPLPVYGDGMNVRDWLHVSDHCAALLTVLQKGLVGEVYNIGGNNERTNIDIVKRILAILGKPDSLIAYVRDRPGHDRRYAIDATKMHQQLRWTPTMGLDDGLAETVEWYADHPTWWTRVMTGEYLEYYRRNYEHV